MELNHVPNPPFRDAPPDVREGRRRVLWVIFWTLAMSVAVIVRFNAVRGPERLPQQLFRFALTVALCWFLHRGANWARLLGGTLFAIASILGLVSMVRGGDVVVTLAFATIYGQCAWALLGNRNVRAYFRYRTERRPMKGLRRRVLDEWLR